MSLREEAAESMTAALYPIRDKTAAQDKPANLDMKPGKE
jgi:hypothetical protein